MIARIGNTIGQFRIRYDLDVRQGKAVKGRFDKKLKWLAVNGSEIDIDSLEDLLAIVDKCGEIVVGKYGETYYIEILDGYRE